jgi:DNA-binding transcriptional ArsR family regulator
MTRTHSASSETGKHSAQLFLNKEKAHDLINMCKLLSDETRLKILQLLLHQKEYCVKAFCEFLHQSQPAVSHHIALLRNAGFIELRREGKHNFYSIVPKRFRDVRDALQGKSGNSHIWARLFGD